MLAKMTDEQLDQLLRSHQIIPPDNLKVSSQFILSEVNRRKKRRWMRTGIVTLIPVGILAVGFGYEQSIDVSVSTQHVNHAIAKSQYTQMLHGESRGNSALTTLEGWLQKQEDNNPATWDKAPFKGYQIKSLTHSDPTHATASVQVLDQNNQWHTYSVLLAKRNNKWAVSSPPIKP